MFRAGKRAILARIIGALNRGPAGPEQARHCAPSLSFSLDIACALPSRSCVGKETREKAKTARAHTRERVSAIYASRDPALTMASIVYLEIAAGNESSLEVFRMPSFVPRERERERVREIERERRSLWIKRCHCLDGASVSILCPAFVSKDTSQKCQDRPVVCSTDYRPFIGTARYVLHPSLNSQIRRFPIESRGSIRASIRQSDDPRETVQCAAVISLFLNRLSVFDDYIRHGDVAEFCVTTAISVVRETLLQFDI